jgi:hypothetical protein
MLKGLLTTLLVLAFVAAAARPCAAVEGEMSEAEAREARSLALRFVERLRETDDFEPLVKEFFPADFDERVRQFVAAAPRRAGEDFLAAFDRAAVLRAGPSEMRRSYVALMNFWNQQNLIGLAALAYVKLRCEAAGEEPCGREQHRRLMSEAIPDEARRVAAADPMLEAMLASFDDEDGDEDDDAEADEATERAPVIRDPARLRAYNDRLDALVKLLRGAAARLRADAKSYAAVHSLTASYEETGAAAEGLKVYRLSERQLEAPSFGLPAGALLIQARIHPFVTVIGRADGRLQILAVYPDFDGD